MSKIIKIGICKKNSEKIDDVEFVEVLPGKGVVNDRHFTDHNDERKQITLIESESIDLYNCKKKIKIPYLSFRRNMVTKGIRLNSLVGKELTIGSVKLKGNDLCRPCSHLEKILGHDDIIKEFLLRGGLRCEILSSGKIFNGDKINL